MTVVIIECISGRKSSPLFVCHRQVLMDPSAINLYQFVKDWGGTSCPQAFRDKQTCCLDPTWVACCKFCVPSDFSYSQNCFFMFLPPSCADVFVYVCKFHRLFSLVGQSHLPIFKHVGERVFILNIDVKCLGPKSHSTLFHVISQHLTSFRKINSIV